MAEEYISLSMQHNVSHAAGAALWNWFQNNAAEVAATPLMTYRAGYKTLRRKAGSGGPKVIVGAVHKNRVTGEVVETFGRATFPRKRFAAREWQCQVETYHSSIAEIIQFHKALHAMNGLQCNSEVVQLSSDGVPESRQNTVVVTSLRFQGCHHVYSVKVVKTRVPDKKPTATARERAAMAAMTVSAEYKGAEFLVGDVIKDLIANHVKVRKPQ